MPDGVANQIAAGEVVGRPASVVKEMVENAVDAGARSITVNYRDGGKALIQVVDDGCGMSDADARMAFERHATSKIRTADDIYHLLSFGFRGEALPSIASVAEVELLTRQSGAELGTQVVIHGGRFVSQEPVQCSEGTQFMVRNLFYNTPARRRFVKDATQESRFIRSEFLRVALCNPDVSFTLCDNDLPIVTLQAANLRQRIVDAVGGRKIMQNLLEVKVSTSLVTIEGFVGRPTAAKRANKEQYLFVNGRFFRSLYLRKAVLQAYDKLIAADEQPSYFLYLTIDPSRIDVNVHPQKTEVKFDDEPAVWQFVNAAVRETLGRMGLVPMMDFEMDPSIDVPVYDQKASFNEPVASSNPYFNPFENEPPTDAQSTHRSFQTTPNTLHATDLYDIVDRGSLSDCRVKESHNEEPFEEYDSSVVEFIEGNEARQQHIDFETAPQLFGLLPLGDRYCAVRTDRGLAVVNLLRARERVLFDRYMGRLGNNASATQQLLFPEHIELSGDDLQTLRSMKEQVEMVGFDVTFDEGYVAVTGIPAELTVEQTEPTLQELAETFRNTGTIDLGKRQERLAAVMARHAALQGATDRDGVQRLIEELFDCTTFNYTHGGQSVLTYITDDELSKRFGA